MPNILGIDYGTKRIGLAFADELGIAIPLGAIPGVELKDCWEKLGDEVKRRKIDQFVLGYPINMDGSVGKRAKEVDVFAEKLKKFFGLPVNRVDERLTSLAAEEALGRKSKTKKTQLSGKVDATAACLILKDFLNDSRGQGFSIE